MAILVSGTETCVAMVLAIFKNVERMVVSPFGQSTESYWGRPVERIVPYALVPSIRLFAESTSVILITTGIRPAAPGLAVAIVQFNREAMCWAGRGLPFA